MLATTIGRMGMVALLLALVAGACGDSGGDDDQACHECSTNDGCDGDQECARAVDGELRCFDTGEATCKLGRVEVGRAPTPTPLATP
ncbi:MAG: hypothetical protein IT293_05680 [Deltaproteobacteria bacterium]|nr:hypothetical protein [Deltaproteobacteria bacterium]